MSKNEPIDNSPAACTDRYVEMLKYFPTPWARNFTYTGGGMAHYVWSEKEGLVAICTNPQAEIPEKDKAFAIAACLMATAPRMLETLIELHGIFARDDVQQMFGVENSENILRKVGNVVMDALRDPMGER